MGERIGPSDYTGEYPHFGSCFLQADAPGHPTDVSTNVCPTNSSRVCVAHEHSGASHHNITCGEQAVEKGNAKSNDQEIKSVHTGRNHEQGVEFRSGEASCVGIFPDMRSDHKPFQNRGHLSRQPRVADPGACRMASDDVRTQVLRLYRCSEDESSCDYANFQCRAPSSSYRADDLARDVSGHGGCEDRQTILATLRSALLAQPGHAERRASQHHNAPLVGDIGRLSVLKRTLWRTTGSNSLSGNHLLSFEQGGNHPLPHNRGNHPLTCNSRNYLHQEKPPIYAPETRKTSVEVLKKYFGPQEVYKWLDDRSVYVRALRSRPRSSASRFYNEMRDTDIQTLQQAGVIEPVDKSTLKAFVKIFLVSEKSNTRSRVIIEPRELNVVLKSMNLPKITLPTVKDVVELCTHAADVECIDFKSYFYQIELSPDVRPYFGAIINGKAYQVRVLPQGGCASVLVAQTLTLAAVERATKVDPSVKILVYIDNIYIGYPSTTTPSIFNDSLQPFEIGSRSRGAVADVLGTIVDCARKTLDISESTRQRLKAARVVLTYRDLLSMYGLIAYAARVLHKPMADHPAQMKRLAKVCSSFLLNRIELDDAAPEDDICCVRDFQSIAQMWGAADCTTVSFRQIVFTDASLQGGGCVILDEDQCVHVRAWRWGEDEARLSINRLELRAIEIALSFAKPKDTVVFTDSQVGFFLLHKGYARDPYLNDIVRRILSRRCATAVTWLPGERNPADTPSRNVDLDGTVFQMRVLPDREIAEFTAPYNNERLWYDGKWTV